MTTNEKSVSPMAISSTQSGRHVSPSPQGLRSRPLGRAATFADGYAQLNRRRSSFLSETLSETRKSFRSSTDDILQPRARGEHDQDQDEASHWHSLPLALALLPAIGGMFFQNGSAFITDATLLVLAAIFMNWALRSPWDWYHASQSSIISEAISPSVLTPVEEPGDYATLSPKSEVPDGDETPKKPIKPSLKIPQTPSAAAASAQRELRVHEILALTSCFICPLMAAWLLHAIRSQLTRPSEGLVSNYNLTIFILVAEVRPLAHLIKLVQRRTLFLQRRANADALSESRKDDTRHLLDMSQRLDALELHVADNIASSGNETGDALAAKVSALATSDVKKLVQPELDALNRAMRRYEKRTAISSVQIEARLQDLEGRLQDMVALAAAVQRNADRQSQNYTSTLINWMSAAIVLPMQGIAYLTSIPGAIVSNLVVLPKRYMSKAPKMQGTKEPRSSRKTPSSRIAERQDGFMSNDHPSPQEHRARTVKYGNPRHPSMIPAKHQHLKLEMMHRARKRGGGNSPSKRLKKKARTNAPVSDFTYQVPRAEEFDDDNDHEEGVYLGGSDIEDPSMSNSLHVDADDEQPDTAVQPRFIGYPIQFPPTALHINGGVKCPSLPATGTMRPPPIPNKRSAQLGTASNRSIANSSFPGVIEPCAALQIVSEIRQSIHGPIAPRTPHARRLSETVDPRSLIHTPATRPPTEGDYIGYGRPSLASTMARAKQQHELEAAMRASHPSSKS